MADILLGWGAMLVASTPVTDLSPATQDVPRGHRFVILQIIAALIGALALAASQYRSATALRVYVSVLSDERFAEEVPRTAQLIVVRTNGAKQTLVSRCFAAARLDPRNTFQFQVPAGAIQQLLLSPDTGGHVVGVTNVTIQRGVRATPEKLALADILPVGQVEVLERTADRLVIRTQNGPALPEVRIDRAAELSAPRTDGILLLEAAVAFVFAFAGVGLAIRQGERYVRTIVHAWPTLTKPLVVGLGCATACAACMALVSRFNAHPDEYLHFETARCFATYWLPPALDSIAATPTFSHYGFSYLHDLDTSYIAMGKFIAGASWCFTPETAARLFNVLLFALLSTHLLIRLRHSLAPAILLISPQVWYVFSYVNGDAWALTVALLIAAELASDKSSLARFLGAEKWRAAWKGGVLFALLLASIVMAKRNYYLFLPLVALFAIWDAFVWKRRSMLVLAKRWTAIVLTAVVFWLPLRAMHQAVNRFDISRLTAEQAEKAAAPHFRPSDLASGNGSPRLNLRGRGISFGEVWTTYGWAAATFQSFCGVYRWMNLRGPLGYYFAMGSMYAALIAALLIGTLRLPWRDRLFAGAVFALAAAVVLVSAYYSWTADFQPQGRYLFPILPMFALLLHRYRESLRWPVLNLLFLGLFAAGAYSFVFTGLRLIPK